MPRAAACVRAPGCCSRHPQGEEPRASGCLLCERVSDVKLFKFTLNVLLRSVHNMFGIEGMVEAPVMPGVLLSKPVRLGQGGKPCPAG